MLNFRSRIALVALTATAGVVPNAKADILAFISRTVPSVGGAGPFITLPLNDTNATFLPFTTTQANQKVAITFNAECKVQDGGYVTVVINVDGKPTDPKSGNNFAFCSTNSGNTAEPIAVVRQAFTTVTTVGSHQAAVTATGVNGPAHWQLDDTSLLVQN